jgi:hypothetical protein
MNQDTVQPVQWLVTRWITRVQFPAETGAFFLHDHVQTNSEAHPVSYPMGTSSLPLAKQLRNEADHLPPYSANNAWSYTSTL